MRADSCRREIRATLDACGKDGALESNAILSHVLGLSHAELLLHGDRVLTDEEQQRVNDLTAQRTAGIPLAYLFGSTPFFGLQFFVGEGVLIPRADSEVLVEEALKLSPSPRLLFDLCCGSGCLMLATLANTAHCRAVGVDCSEKALQYAAANIARHHMGDRAVLLRADVLRGPWPEGLADLILCNPPYIASQTVDTLAHEVLCEPRLALDGGFDGLHFYRTLLPALQAHLAPGGHVLFEIGYDQADAVASLAADAGYETRLRRDYGGRDRVLLLTKTEETTVNQ